LLSQHRALLVGRQAGQQPGPRDEASVVNGGG